MNWGIYLLPSIFTLGNMALGFYSMLCSYEGLFSTAAWAILAGIVLDGFDGTVARLTKSTSRMGIEVDSFADFVTFCIAPAVLMYFVMLHGYGTPGLIVAFVYIMFGMFRLARFNVQVSETYGTPAGPKATYYFEGLPTPAAGGILAAFVLVFELFQRFEQGITRKAIPLLMERMPFMFKSLPVVMLILSFLMISKLPYTSFSKTKISKRIPLRTFALIVIGLSLIIAYPESMVFVMFFMYILSGLIEYFNRAYVLKRARMRQHKGA